MAIEFAIVTIDHPDISRLMSELRWNHANGGALIACFDVSGHEQREWFMTRSPLVDTYSFDLLLYSSAFAAALPQLGTPTAVAGVTFTEGDPLTLDGELAGALARGGAYRAFRGSASIAKDLAMAFCHAVFGDRYGDVWVFRSKQAWSTWFHDSGWDTTWVLADTGPDRVWVLCITDTD